MSGLALDTLDDRKEIWHLLHRLSPARRIGFVDQLCRTVVLPGSLTHPGVQRKTWDLANLAQRDDSADSRLTTDLYFDCWHISQHYDRFSWEDVLARLVRLVRRI